MAWRDRQDLRSRPFRTEEIVTRNSGEDSRRVIEQFFFYNRKKAKFGQVDRTRFTQDNRQETVAQPAIKPFRHSTPPPPHHLRGW